MIADDLSVRPIRPPAQAAGGWDALRLRTERACAARGTQLPALRESVLKALWTATVPLGAYDLADRLSGRGNGQLAPNSVYRVLMLFQDLGIVRKVESRHAYVVASSVDPCAGVFLLCDRCGAVKEVTDSGVEALLAARAAALGFHPTRQVIEVAGRCLDCDGPAD